MYVHLCVYFISNWFGTNAFKLLFGSWSLKASNIHMTYFSTCFPISFFTRKYTKGCYFFTWIHLIKATEVLLCNCSWFLIFLVQVGEHNFWVVVMVIENVLFLNEFLFNFQQKILSWANVILNAYLNPW